MTVNLDIVLINLDHASDKNKQHMWLRRVKCGVLVGLTCFELEVRLCSMGDEVLIMRSLEL